MFPDKNWETNPNKEWDIRAMVVHAAMVDVLDQCIVKGKELGILLRRKKEGRSIEA
jgi:hypothetical protein